MHAYIYAYICNNNNEKLEGSEEGSEERYLGETDGREEREVM